MTSPIVIVEDDSDDCQFLVSALSDIGDTHPVECFKDGAEALSYLETTQNRPFLILSDINMPIMNGLELLENISRNDVLRKKGFPFIFLSTSVNSTDIKKSFDMSAHGYFQKVSSYNEVKELLQKILDYWKKAERPNKFSSSSNI